MLKDLINEWNNALSSSVGIEDRLNETDHETFEYRKAVLQFRGKRVEILSKRDPNSGLNADGKADPEKGPKYSVTIFVPETGKIIKNLPAKTSTPQADKMVSILESLDLVDHAENVRKHRLAQEERHMTSRSAQWEKMLSSTSYSDDEKKLFIDYAKELSNHPTIHFRGELFIRVVKQFEGMLTDREEITATHGRNAKVLYTYTDVLYNSISQLVSSELKNKKGDMFITNRAIMSRFNDTTIETEEMTPTIKKVRAALRELYVFCRENPFVLAYILNGIAKYFEAITGESVQMRMAKLDARKKERALRAARPTQETKPWPKAKPSHSSSDKNRQAFGRT